MSSSSSTSSTPQLIFYDISSAPPLRTFAPNPWKIRYALNLLRVPYETRWTDLPDIPSVREDLGVPANRTHRDGKPYHTLPLLHDLSRDAICGDSFEIALHLHRNHPSSSSSPSQAVLFREGTVGLVAALNSHVDGLFTRHVGLCDRMPFDGHPREAEIRKVFTDRFGVGKWEDLVMPAAAREELFVGLEGALGEFRKAYDHVGGTTDYLLRPGGTGVEQAQRSGREEGGEGRVWLDGERPVYADLIVGAWLAMFEGSMRKEDWERVRGWHGGFWGRIHDALEPLRTIV